MRNITEVERELEKILILIDELNQPDTLSESDEYTLVESQGIRKALEWTLGLTQEPKQA